VARFDAPKPAPESCHLDAVNRETAAMDAPKAAAPRAVALQLAEACPGDRERPELEAYVRAAFARSHAAQVHTFMPSLLGFRDARQRLRGVLGLRAAAAAPLYLEHYLDQPVEDAIAGATGQPLRRTEIVEVGHLAAGNCRSAVGMIAQLPAYLLARDFGWIVFTATRTVRQILLGLGAPLVELARADGARVANGMDAWGGYYDNDPRVFAGHLPESWRLAAFTHGGQDH
jgi:hypothetical protein